jgi:dihydrofolate reductase
MRIVTCGAACSLDGFITDRDGTVDWLHFSKDVGEVMSTYLATVDTLLMGRLTWEVAAAQGGAGREGGAAARFTTYLFSRTLQVSPHPDAQLVSGDAGAFVHDLKRRPGRGICVMGGGILAQSLFEADVIDEVGLNIHPILLGAGTPLFRDAGRRVPLALKECRTLAGGCVLATYRVKHARRPTAVASRRAVVAAR